MRIDVRNKDRVFARHGTTVIGLKKTNGTTKVVPAGLKIANQDVEGSFTHIPAMVAAAA